MKLTELEILAIEESPEVLRIVADWRDFQQDSADSIGSGSEGDGKRASELRAEADRIEVAY
jgi:hypothetical protein